MRQSLINTFSDIRILDLHGNSMREEKSLCESDENVFDIRQGVSINLFSKISDETNTVRHADLWGTG